MVYIVGLNGPPHSGKDTIGLALAEHPEWTIPSFTFQVFTETVTKAGFNLLGYHYSAERYAEEKEREQEALNGDTFRRWQIRFSEEFMKPAYGDDIFGKLAVSRINEMVMGNIPAIVFITDCGFAPEQLQLVNYAGIENYQLIHLYRDGCDWSKDSRGYIELPDVDTHVIHNNDTVTWAVETIRSQLIRRGWSL